MSGFYEMSEDLRQQISILKELPPRTEVVREIEKIVEVPQTIEVTKEAPVVQP